MGTNTPAIDHITLERWSPDRGPLRPRWTLATLMAARCLSGGELARLAGVSRGVVSRALNHQGTTSMPTRRKLASALAVETDAIQWTPPAPDPTPAPVVGRRTRRPHLQPIAN
jgi:hypothetical protein